MSDFLTRTAQLALGLAHSIEPLIAPRFAPQETLDMPRDDSAEVAERVAARSQVRGESRVEGVRARVIHHRGTEVTEGDGDVWSAEATPPLSDSRERDEAEAVLPQREMAERELVETRREATPPPTEADAPPVWSAEAAPPPREATAPLVWSAEATLPLSNTREHRDTDTPAPHSVIADRELVELPRVDSKAEALPPRFKAERVSPSQSEVISQRISHTRIDEKTDVVPQRVSQSRGDSKAEALPPQSKAEPVSQSHADSKAEALPPHSTAKPVSPPRVSQPLVNEKAEALYSRADRKPEPEPVIVEIGRIEVVPPAPPPALPAPPAGVPPMTLDGYLSRRKGRR